ncbi:hypothetical protein [Helicobacter sp. CLO-3]|uniref:hypothetical protein n=1 Tax=Helicobacter sp. CLO-3 TaxID=211 RepID=UPI0015A1FEAD|nr:hypothetical protein [Helicobacter sp. CLO-3]
MKINLENKSWSASNALDSAFLPAHFSRYTQTFCLRALRQTLDKHLPSTRPAPAQSPRQNPNARI